MKGILLLLVNKIYNEDCLIGLKKIPDNSIDLVVIDPPYDISTKGGKKGTGKLCKELINGKSRPHTRIDPDGVPVWNGKREESIPPTEEELKEMKELLKEFE